jgi:metal-sulfur cluster biosynthetic enzyme
MDTEQNLEKPTVAKVWDALYFVEDPEFRVNVVDMGLVYGVEVDEEAIRIRYTLTTPDCPYGEQLFGAIVFEMRQRFDVDRVVATTVWEPLWHPSMMTEVAKLELGYPI